MPSYVEDALIVERLRRNHFAIRIETNRFPGLPLVTIWSNDSHPAGGFKLQGSAGDATRPEEAPLAICLAALRAVGVEVPTER